MSALLQVMAAYGLATVALVVIDLLWLGVVARPRRERGLGLRRLIGNVGRKGSAGLLLYALFAVGMLVFAVRPSG